MEQLEEALIKLFEQDINFCNEKFSHAPEELTEALNELKDKEA